MALKGKSFSIDTGKLDAVFSNVRNAEVKADTLIQKKIIKATDIVSRIAHSKRPMITKAQMKAEGRTQRVSNPDAQAGVPVDTGALQASIRQTVSAKSGKWIGRVATKGIPYASMIEFGTSKMQARPFMRPAINLTRDALKAMFSKSEK